MLTHYRDTTGLADDKIRKYLLPPQDVWLSAEEALNLKICDSVSSHNHLAPPSTTEIKPTTKAKTK
jgi:ATP-dependent protease ClpP protease subunit